MNQKNEIASANRIANKPSTTRLAVIQMGARAVKVVEKIADGGEWTPEVLRRAADAFEHGDGAYGLRRSWSMLAARLRNLAAGAETTTDEASATVEDAAAGVPPKATRARTAKKGAKEPKPAATPNDDAPPDLDETDGRKPAELAGDAPDGITLAALAEAYLQNLEKTGKSRGTVFSYSIDLGVATKYFGKDLAAVTLRTEDVAEFFESAAVTTTRTGKAKSDITIAKTRRVLRLALEWAAGAGLIPVAPVPQKAAASETAPDDATETTDAPFAGASA
jgi:hypothetical protein